MHATRAETGKSSDGTKFAALRGDFMRGLATLSSFVAAMTLCGLGCGEAVPRPRSFCLAATDCSAGFECVAGECQLEGVTSPPLFTITDAGETRGSVESDAGEPAPPSDSGAGSDAASVESDAGANPGADAGTPVSVDAGTPVSVDAGTGGFDAGSNDDASVGPDSGWVPVMPDAGPPPPASQGEPCGANDDCETSLYCAGTGCGTPGTCETRGFACATIYDPVCGCNGVTYSNRCAARTTGERMKSAGPCP